MVLRPVCRAVCVLGAMTLTCFALAAGPRGAGVPFSWHWGVSGKFAHEVPTTGLPFQRDVVIFYQHDFGVCPYVHKDKAYNGGIPQRCDLQAHLAKVRIDVEQAIPDPEWSGFAVIDHEGWDVLWDKCSPAVQELGRAWVRESYPDRSARDVERLAKASFESAAKRFLLETIETCKAVRPRAKWGYYGYPWAHHAAFEKQLSWLWEASGALYPCVYTWKYGVEPAQGGPKQDQAPIAEYEAAIDASIQLSRRFAGEKPVMAFLWLRYHDLLPAYKLQMVNPLDLRAMLERPCRAGADGAILWEDIDTAELAAAYRAYFLDALGPAMARAQKACAAGDAAPTETPAALGKDAKP